MPVCDLVHFPLTLHPHCHTVFTSCRHDFTYSRPAVGIPASALNAFWLSTHSTMSWFFVPDSTILWMPSWIAWISLSSMSPLVPIWQWRSNLNGFWTHFTRYHILLVRPDSLFHPSVCRRMVSLLRPVVHSLWSGPYCSVVTIHIVGGSMNLGLIRMVHSSLGPTCVSLRSRSTILFGPHPFQGCCAGPVMA